MQRTTYNTETELSSVNSILGAIGQAPVTTLEFENPEIALVHNLLMEADLDVQNEGWVFNREEHYPLLPDVDGYIQVPPNVLRMDVSAGQVWRDTDVVMRNGRLYDKLNHTDIFTRKMEFDIVWRFPYEDLPSVFKRYITYRASVRAATQLMANSELMQMLAGQEAYSRAACMEYECNQGDHSFFGAPPGTHSGYRSYQPYITMDRRA
jgi:hypothetical protein